MSRLKAGTGSREGKGFCHESEGEKDEREDRKCGPQVAREL